MFVNIGNIIAQDLKTGLNEKVSTGDTEMSLHIRSPKTPGGGDSGVVKTQSTQSDKISLNFNFRGGGGKLGFLNQNFNH